MALVTDDKLRTPLHTAAYMGNKSMCEFLSRMPGYLFPPPRPHSRSNLATQRIARVVNAYHVHDDGEIAWRWIRKTRRDARRSSTLQRLAVRLVTLDIHQVGPLATLG